MNKTTKINKPKCEQNISKAVTKELVNPVIMEYIQILIIKKKQQQRLINKKMKHINEK